MSRSSSNNPQDSPTMSFLKHKRSVDDIWPMYNKTVLVRVDFNVPIRNGVIARGKDQRIRAALPTIRAIIDQGGKAVLMSHMGRPQGHQLDALINDEERKQRYLKIWKDEAGTGYTTYFSLCTGEEKKTMLSWSSVAEKAADLAVDEGAGKTDLFASLPNEEKKILLNRFQSDQVVYGRNSHFPQLRQYYGFEDELSLKPVAKRLSELLNEDGSSPPVVVKFAEDCMNAEGIVAELEPGQVILLENVRFYNDETSRVESERLAMAKHIASYGDFFVSDAFGTSHRNSATVVGLPTVMGHGCCGYLLKREIEAYSDLLGEPNRPMVAIVGGAKVSDKILLLDHILPQIDSLIIGGAMAFTFLKVQGYDIANSFHESGQSFLDKYGEMKDIDELARNLLEKAKACNVEVLLPLDHICNVVCEATNTPFVTENENVPAGYMALDIGPRTIQLFQNCIANSRTAVWNGPMGVAEISTYATGSFSIAKAMGDGTQERGLLSIIGGGASAVSAEACGHANRVSHVSSGGGASLDLLEGKVLPGINALNDL
eukprot:g4610.t1 g4610   contig15:1387745-1389472(+)